MKDILIIFVHLLAEKSSGLLEFNLFELIGHDAALILLSTSCHSIIDVDDVPESMEEDDFSREERGASLIFLFVCLFVNF